MTGQAPKPKGRPERISPAMAYRLSKAFDTMPELWVNLQAQFDLWQARTTDVAGVERLVSAGASS